MSTSRVNCSCISLGRGYKWIFDNNK